MWGYAARVDRRAGGIGCTSCWPSYADSLAPALNAIAACNSYSSANGAVRSVLTTVHTCCTIASGPGAACQSRGRAEAFIATRGRAAMLTTEVDSSQPWVYIVG